jgi:hypothetical protein
LNDVTSFKQECKEIDQMFDKIKDNPFFWRETSLPSAL